MGVVYNGCVFNYLVNVLHPLLSNSFAGCFSSIFFLYMHKDASKTFPILRNTLH